MRGDSDSFRKNFTGTVRAFLIVCQETDVKTLCALIGAFFLVAGLAILIAGAPKGEARSAAAEPVPAAGGGEHRPLLWEADVHRSPAGSAATEAVSRSR